MEQKSESSEITAGDTKIKPEKYVWKKSYTIVLIANTAYILFFYFLMNLFT